MLDRDNKACQRLAALDPSGSFFIGPQEMMVDDLTDLRLPPFEHLSVGRQVRQLGRSQGANCPRRQLRHLDQFGGVVLDLLQAFVIFRRKEDHRRPPVPGHCHRLAPSNVAELADMFLKFAGIDYGHGNLLQPMLTKYVNYGKRQVRVAKRSRIEGQRNSGLVSMATLQYSNPAPGFCYRSTQATDRATP
jgi:hypothetical protein